MKPALNLSRILDRYSAIFCDVWGVIRDGHALLPDAIEALQQARSAGRPVVLVSNSPRPSSDLARQLDLMGAPGDAWDGIVTSGDATRLALAEKSPGPFFKIGPPGGDDRLYDGLEIEFSDTEAARAIVCTGLVGTLGDHPDDYRDLFEALVARGLPMVCANPDIVVQVGDELVWCAGALARLYREMGGACVRLGQAGWSADRDSVLAIGDGPETDLAGASRMGLDALFIGDGILGRDMGSMETDAVSAILSEYNAEAAWFAPRLIW